MNIANLPLHWALVNSQAFFNEYRTLSRSTQIGCPPSGKSSSQFKLSQSLLNGAHTHSPLPRTFGITIIDLNGIN